MKSINITKSLLHNFFKSGLLLAVLLTILEYISQSVDLVSFYSFLSGSFILIAFFQYHIIDASNKDATHSFLVHSIIGGILWVFYSILMYVGHTNNLGVQNVILSTFITFSVITLIYYNLIINDVFDFLV